MFEVSICFQNNNVEAQSDTQDLRHLCYLSGGEVPKTLSISRDWLKLRVSVMIAYAEVISTNASSLVYRQFSY
jgi:hypothetical protein